MSELKWDRAFALDQAADDVELLEELLGLFKETFQSDYQQIVDGIANKDSQAVGSAAHSIKGAAASLGIHGVSELARNLEEDSRSGSLTVATANLETMQRLLQEVLDL